MEKMRAIIEAVSVLSVGQLIIEHAAEMELTL